MCQCPCLCYVIAWLCVVCVFETTSSVLELSEIVSVCVLYTYVYVDVCCCQSVDRSVSLLGIEREGFLTNNLLSSLSFSHPHPT